MPDNESVTNCHQLPDATARATMIVRQIIPTLSPAILIDPTRTSTELKILAQELKVRQEQGIRLIAEELTTTAQRVREACINIPDGVLMGYMAEMPGNYAAQAITAYRAALRVQERE